MSHPFFLAEKTPGRFGLDDDFNKTAPFYFLCSKLDLDREAALIAYHIECRDDKKKIKYYRIITNILHDFSGKTGIISF